MHKKIMNLCKKNLFTTNKCYDIIYLDYNKIEVMLMNQILQTSLNQDKKADIKSIIRVFGIIVLIFGIIVVGQGSYAIYKNNAEKSDSENNLPTVNIERQDQKVAISVKHDKQISEILYNWNGGSENRIAGQGRNEINEKIDLPAGDAVLNLKVKDSEGKQVEYKKEYVTDSDNPKINFEVNGSNMKITAESTNTMKSITYSWNGEAETTVDVKNASDNKIEKEIQIPMGRNELKVVAVDSNNETVTKTQKIQGVKKPVVTVVPDADRSYLVIKATDDDNMKFVRYTLNGTTYEINIENIGPTKVIEYRQKVQEGYNRISLKASNIYDVVTEFEGEYTYTP